MRESRPYSNGGTAWVSFGLSMGVLVCLAVVGLAVPGARAQELRGEPARPPGEEAPLGLATDWHPERVRNLLLAIHGFSREALDSVSTEVPAILMAFIDDPNELPPVRRQAAKALQLYPTEPVLAFIVDRVQGAPASVKSLLVRSLGAFAPSAPARVQAVVVPLLDDPEVSVRYAALSVTGSLAASPAVKVALEGRLAREPDPSLQREIRQRLAR